ncbi:MAG: HAMP domain-containing histidine kinase, partial [Acidimicrobiales bacterium]|nr:HAMP domain-containing histidine kinase [Acidimicrobiales bacterium]
SELLAERATTPDEALEPPNSQVALADLVADVVAELGPRATSAGVELRLDLGATDGTAAVPPALRDVAFNLVDNAIDAAASEVVVRVGPGAAEALLVIDDGPGLDGSSARRAFEPFFTTKADGTGMGLAIADAVVAELGGDVTYRRSDGRTVFAVTLSEGTDSQRHEA